MGGELAQEREWSHERSLDWHLLERPEHRGVQTLVGDLNRFYRDEPALWELDGEPAGFAWLELNDARRQRDRVRALLGGRGRARVVCVCNFSPGAATRLPRRAAAAGPLARGAQHRRDRLRRLGRRQRRRGRRRGDRPGTASSGRPSCSCRRSACSGWRPRPIDSARLATERAPNRMIWPGRPFPLGATWDGKGTNFSVFSEHAERVELCLFDAEGREQRYELTQRTAFNWHGYLPGRRARASATACASTARTRPSAGTASTRPSCCSIPTPRRSTAACAGRRRTRCPYRAGRARSRRRWPTTRTTRPRCRAASWSTRRSTGRATGGSRRPGTRPSSTSCT